MKITLFKGLFHLFFSISKYSGLVAQKDSGKYFSKRSLNSPKNVPFLGQIADLLGNLLKKRPPQVLRRKKVGTSVEEVLQNRGIC